MRDLLQRENGAGRPTNSGERARPRCNTPELMSIGHFRLWGRGSVFDFKGGRMEKREVWEGEDRESSVV